MSTMGDVGNPAGFDVEEMFDAIAPTYDFLNHLLSFGRDRSWRRKAAQCLQPNGPFNFIDLAAGTGDLLIAVLCAHRHVTEAVALDLSENMLAAARAKVGRGEFADRVRFIRGDVAETLLPRESFDVATMAFGIRNTPDVAQVLGEMHRLIKPGGRVVILEFSMPAGRVLKPAYLAYLRLGVPAIGMLLSGSRRAYRYLQTSIEAFYRPAVLRSMMERAGFCDITIVPLAWGVASVYVGAKTSGGR